LVASRLGIRDDVCGIYSLEVYPRRSLGLKQKRK